jgi:proteic killer suppression protein
MHRRTRCVAHLDTALVRGPAWGLTQGFRHKGLRRFIETDSTAGIQADHGRKLRLQLAALHSAAVVEDLDLPGYRLHQLKGADKGRWVIWVNANWRLTFMFRESHVDDVDYEDYH